MKSRTRKIVACIQIVLQLLPPSSLLYLSPLFNASAQEINTTTKTTSADNENRTQNDVAQVAVQAGSLLSNDNASDSLGNALASAATGKAAANIQQWLGQFGTARVNISTNEHFTLNDSDIDLLAPLYNGQENLLFTQIGGRRHDDRNIVNGGFGYRHFNDGWMWGTNIFYDRQISDNQHQRLGFGSEFGWDYLKISANGYFRLSDWKSSDRYDDFDERVANGFDVRATGYLPAYPQLGANIIYEQYFGDSVGLFGDDEDDRQKDPYAVTLGLNYTPVPLVTMGLNQKMGKSGENDTQVSLAVNWAPGVPLSAQLDPSQVALRRSLQGSRMDLVDRNNNIVLEYRKQELITLSIPPKLEGMEQSRQSVTAKVKSKYGLDRVEWQGDAFFSHGGKISAGNSPEQFVLTLPGWQGRGGNSYMLSATAWDKKGNASKPDRMNITVNGVDVNTLQSTTTVSPTSLPADGTSTATVTVTLKTHAGDAATGLAPRLTATLSASGVAAKKADPTATTDKAPAITSFTESGDGQYTATLTSGSTPGTLTIQPLIDGTVKLAAAKLTQEAAVVIPQLATLDASATSALASGSTPIVLTAHVTDQYGKELPGAVVAWSADNSQAVLSDTQSRTDENGAAQIQVSSKEVISTVVTAQLEGGNSLTTPSLMFIADMSTARVAEIDSDKQQIVANNTDTGTVTALVIDNYNHPLSGVTVNWVVKTTDNVPVKSKTSITDSSGTAILTLKSPKMGSVMVSAEVNGTSAQIKEPIVFVADSASKNISAITPSKPQAVANGTDSITYEATVTDALGNAVQGATVTWSADSTDAKLSGTQTTSDSNGKSHITVTTLKAGDVVVSAGTSSTTMKPADSITFTADTRTATVTTLQSDRPTALANGTDGIVLSATVADANGNLLQDADVSWASDPTTGILSASSTKTDTHGVAKVTLTSQEVAVYSVTAANNGTTKRVSGLSFIADTSTAHLDNLMPSTNSALADGKSAITLTATVVDKAGHPVKDEQINWYADNDKAQLSASSSMTDEQGQARIQVTSKDVISTVITAQHNQAEAKHTDTLNFTADTTSAKVMSINSQKDQVVANNIDSSTITAQVLDSYGHPLGGITVNWSAKHTDGTLVKSVTSVTDSAGEATWTLKSAKTGAISVSAGVSGTEAKETGPITFVADKSTARVSLLAPDKTQATANGKEAITYNATVMDAQGNPITEATISWSADNSDVRLSATQTVSGIDGTSQISVTSLKSGDVIITAQTSEATAKQADRATFVADAATAKVASITSDKPSALANGTDAIVISATVTDANGNLLAGSDVSWAHTPTSGKLSADSSKSDTNGVAQVELSSEAVEKYTVVASSNGTSQSLQNLSFTADSSTAQVTSLRADNTTGIVADKDSVLLTAVVVDARNHPVSGVTVNWSSSESNSSFSVNSSVTGADGTATASFSSLKAGSIEVTASTGSSSKVLSLDVIGNVETAQVSDILPDKTQAVADGVEEIAWTAAVTDANGNVLNGVTVNWRASRDGVTLTTTSSDTDENGQTSTKGRSLKAGKVQMTVTPAMNAAGKKTGGDAKFIGDLKTAQLTTLTPSSTSVPINGVEVTFTAVVNDANNNPVEGQEVSWQTDLNTLSASISTTDASGEATVKLKGGTRGPATVTAKANNTNQTSMVTFVDTITYNWVITETSASYRGETIYDYPASGYVVSGDVQGPTKLIWNGSDRTPSTLTVPMRDEKGATHNVIFKGMKTDPCGTWQFNSGMLCEGPHNTPELRYYASDNPDLPAGNYSGHITFSGQDWYTKANLLSYDITTLLTVN